MVRQEPRHRNLDKEDNAILESTWMRWVDLFRGLFSLLPSRVSSGMIWREEESGGRDRLRGCWRAKMKGDDISSRLGMSAATDFISPLLLLSFSFSFFFNLSDTRHLYYTGVYNEMERILSFRGLTKREKNWDRVLLFSFLSSLFDEKPQFEYHASLTNNEYRKITNKTKIEIYFHIYNRISCIDSLYGSRFRKKGQ